MPFFIAQHWNHGGTGRPVDFSGIVAGPFNSAEEVDRFIAEHPLQWQGWNVYVLIEPTRIGLDMYGHLKIAQKGESE